jgi:hypothetical protein
MPWSKFFYNLANLAVAAVVGTIVLLAMADDPSWDELIKGPATGIMTYGANSMTALFGKAKALGS